MDEPGDIVALRSRIVQLEDELEKLRYSGEIIRKAELAAGTGSWSLHLDTGIMYASEGSKLIYGIDKEYFSYEEVKNIPLPEYRQILDEALKNLIEKGKPYDITFRIKNASTGRLIDIHSIAEYDRKKRILLGTIQDITAQKKEEEARKRNRLDLSILLRITMNLLEADEKRKMLQKIVEGALQLIGLDTGAVYSLKGDTIIQESTWPPLPPDFPEEFRYAKLENHPHIAAAVARKTTVMVPDIEKEILSEEERIITSKRRMNSMIYIPLLVMQKPAGVMILATSGRIYEFSDREIDLCQTISNIGSLTLENALLFEQLNNNIRELKSAIQIKEKAEEKLRLLNRAVEQSPVSIVITNQQGNIEYVNPKFTELTGYTFEESIGKNPAILKSGLHSKDFYKQLWDRITAGKDWFGEMMNKKKSGDFYWENVLISPMTDEKGSITHFVGIKEDITEKKAMLENLINAKEKAEESDRLKTSFLHNISHEIRTPLNAIVGFSTFLSDPDLTPDKRSMYTDIIISSNDQLLTIIDGIMKISTIETGQVNIRQTKSETYRLVSTLYNQFQPVATKKNLGFTLDCGNVTETTLMFTDEGKLRQILTNLLDNAFKFTHEGSIRFSCNSRDEFIEFSVEDTGIGIPKEEQGKIFERFYQTKKPDSHVYSGTGLGLSICAGYASILGGSLSVQSSSGKGSVFCLTLPVNASL
jgi:PAS domain S-box-containing protein